MMMKQRVTVWGVNFTKVVRETLWVGDFEVEIKTMRGSEPPGEAQGAQSPKCRVEQEQKP